MVRAARLGGAPRFLGTDERGREVLSFIDGHVAWEPVQPPSVTSDASLARLAQLVREFHDLTAGIVLAASAEVVCHNDLSPKNTVYRDGGTGTVPVAFIDWDIAAPGKRIHDLAHVCWQHLDLGPGVADPAVAGRRMRLICDAYGLPDRGSLLETILWWQDRCWRGIEAKAAGGDLAMIRLRDSGAARSVRDAFDWVSSHRAETRRPPHIATIRRRITPGKRGISRLQASRFRQPNGSTVRFASGKGLLHSGGQGEAPRDTQHNDHFWRAFDLHAPAELAVHIGDDARLRFPGLITLREMAY